MITAARDVGQELVKTSCARPEPPVVIRSGYVPLAFGRSRLRVATSDAGLLSTVTAHYALLARRVDQLAALLAVPEVAWTRFARCSALRLPRSTASKTVTGSRWPAVALLGESGRSHPSCSGGRPTPQAVKMTTSRQRPRLARTPENRLFGVDAPDLTISNLTSTEHNFLSS
jgi:hypothetical protein